ncbi:hypothetical protein ACO22_07721, partial [Paracoccidioides brasiliensis]
RVHLRGGRPGHRLDTPPGFNTFSDTLSVVKGVKGEVKQPASDDGDKEKKDEKRTSGMDYLKLPIAYWTDWSTDYN